jgi:hypothetical protein
MIGRGVIFTGLLIGIGTGTAAAQPTGDSPLQIGDRIRIKTPSSSSAIKGTLVAADDVGLTLAPEGRDTSHRKFARSEIAKVEVVRGKKSHWLAGAVAGAAGGLVLTALYCGNGWCDESGEWAGSAAFFGGIGAAGGALVGVLIRTDRWQDVPSEGLKVGVRPMRGRGLALTLRLSF